MDQQGHVAYFNLAGGRVPRNIIFYAYSDEDLVKKAQGFAQCMHETLDPKSPLIPASDVTLVRITRKGAWKHQDEEQVFPPKAAA